MPLYIANTEQWRATAETTDLSTLILQAPGLQILQQAKSALPDRRPNDEPQNIFELHNTLSARRPYVLLPTVCPSILLTLHTHASACYLCGPLTAARKFFIPANAVVMCVQLKPGQLWRFNKRLPSGLTNQVIPLYKCFVDADILLDCLNQQTSSHGRVREILQFLNRKYADSPNPDPVIAQCLESMQRTQGICRIREIANTTARSERFLSRSFRDVIGLSMKTYCEILKFQNSLFGISTLQPRNLTSVANDFGYYDLPHMNRAYRKFINHTASDVRFISPEEMYIQELPLE